MSACVLVSSCVCVRVSKCFHHRSWGALKRPEKEADERRKRREDVRRRSKNGESGGGKEGRLGDATDVHVTARDFGKRRRRKDPNVFVVRTPGKKTATKPFRTADVTTNSALDDTTTTTTTRGGAARFTAGGGFSRTRIEASSTPSIDSPEIEGTSAVVGVVVVFVAEVVLVLQSALDAWADDLVGRGDEEVKEEKVAGTTPTKTTLKWKKTVLVPSRAMPTMSTSSAVAEMSYELSDSRVRLTDVCRRGGEF